MTIIPSALHSWIQEAFTNTVGMRVLKLRVKVELHPDKQTGILDVFTGDQAFPLVISLSESHISVQDVRNDEDQVYLQFPEGITFHHRESLTKLNPHEFNAERDFFRCPGVRSRERIHLLLSITPEEIAQATSQKSIPYGARCAPCVEFQSEADRRTRRLFSTMFDDIEGDSMLERLKRLNPTDATDLEKMRTRLDKKFDQEVPLGHRSLILRCWQCHGFYEKKTLSSPQNDIGSLGIDLKYLEALHFVLDSIRVKLGEEPECKVALKSETSDHALLIHLMEGDILLFRQDFDLLVTDTVRQQVKFGKYHKVLFKSTNASRLSTRKWLADPNVASRSSPQNALDSLLNELNFSRERFLDEDEMACFGHGFHVGFLLASDASVSSILPRLPSKNVCGLRFSSNAFFIHDGH